MNRNFTAIILIALAIGIYFSFTQNLIEKNREIQAVNDQYKVALKNSEDLISIREKVLADYNSISEDDRNKLEKLLPSSVDNIRLILDLNSIALRNGFQIKNVKATASTDENKGSNQLNVQQQMDPTMIGMGESGVPMIDVPTLDYVKVTFQISAPYLQFINFLHDIESNLRLMDVTKISMNVGESSGTYDFNVELKTYWLKQ